MLDRALEALRAAGETADDPDIRSEALRRQADVHRILCDWEAAVDAARVAQRFAEQAGLPLRFAEALNSEASVAIARGDLDRARELLEEMVRVPADERIRGIGLQNLGSVYAHQGLLDAAERAFAESSSCFRNCGYERGQAISLNNQGRAALDGGDIERATSILNDAVLLSRRVEDEELIALATTNLAEASLVTEDYARAHDLVCTALGHFRVSGNRWREVECLRLLGTINERRGFGDDALRCYERALELARVIGAQLEVAALTAQLARIAAPPAG